MSNGPLKYGLRLRPPNLGIFLNKTHTHFYSSNCSSYTQTQLRCVSCYMTNRQNFKDVNDLLDTLWIRQSKAVNLTMFFKVLSQFNAPLQGKHYLRAGLGVPTSESPDQNVAVKDPGVTESYWQSSQRLYLWSNLLEMILISVFSSSTPSLLFEAEEP